MQAEPPADTDYRWVDGADKMSALRLNPVVAEIACAEQGRDTLSTGGLLADVVLCFAGTGETSAEYVGAYRVSPVHSDFSTFETKYARHLLPWPQALIASPARYMVAGLGLSSRPSPRSVFYNLEDANAEVLVGMRGRLVVRWNSPLKWVQRRTDREVLEVRRSGFVRAWSDYLDFSLTWHELNAIVSVGTTDAEWKTRLSSVHGVYLILDTNPEQHGRMYVGSASGDGGIWGRWCRYGSSEWHGDNVELVRIHQQDSGYARRHFQYSVLQTFSRGAARQVVLEAESRWKHKLGKRAVGLTLNRN